MTKDFEKVPLKIAKVTLSNLELVSKMTSETSINGCIGSISVMKLVNCGNKYQSNVFMVGGNFVLFYFHLKNTVHYLLKLKILHSSI